ncbi:hypothetical protein NDU88_008692 [Pleurodeles waltl]|uniref:Uncharacterized protein n=1 Tax=Pleurodeles waltl TaxID=8319 RepID=A0AAV7P022_PLEWA|nr:hypothetical protein NDU88_008692 [Pleurodeles waltl]
MLASLGHGRGIIRHLGARCLGSGPGRWASTQRTPERDRQLGGRTARSPGCQAASQYRPVSAGGRGERRASYFTGNSRGRHSHREGSTESEAGGWIPGTSVFTAALVAYCYSKANQSKGDYLTLHADIIPLAIPPAYPRPALYVSEIGLLVVYAELLSFPDACVAGEASHLFFP